MAIQNVTNGTHVFELQEFNDLLKALRVEEKQSYKSVIIHTDLNKNHIIIDGIFAYSERFSNSQERTDSGIWYMAEYNALCKKLGVVDIKKSTRETLIIQENAAVSMIVEYITGGGV